MIHNTPLAERLRPQKIEEYIGQDHLLGTDGTLSIILKSPHLPSMILWGPPGVGKTTLAKLIAKETNRKIHILSAVQAGVKEVREVLSRASERNFFSAEKPILFIDEIHRFSKSQQDSLLNSVEKGDVILIGATTENPSFEVISALLSRCQVYTLKNHSKKDLEKIVNRAIEQDEFLSKKNIEIESLEYLLQVSGGDARKLLNALEIVASSFPNEVVINNDNCQKILKKNLASYDKNGEMHYDIISAFIKSIRGSDPNATIYWLAQMIAGGEDVKFIARRLLISASEDIGNANPTALVIANNTFQAVEKVGYPEARIILSQCALYLANSPKSNASYLAIDQALADIKRNGQLPVPLHLRNAPTKLMKELDYGKGYQYSHDFPHNFVAQDFLPEEIRGKKFYEPGNNPKENQWKHILQNRWKGFYEY